MLTIASDSATIGTTEHFLASDSTVATYQTAQGKIKVYLDLNAMAAGDQYQITIYEKVNGGTARAIMAPAVQSGAQSSLWESPEFTGHDGWEIGVKKLAGTDRAIAWSIKRMNGDAITAGIWNALTASYVVANSFGALVGALPTAAAVATAVGAYVYEGALTVQGLLRLTRSILINKASGLEGAAVAFRDAADTKNRVSFALSGGAGKDARVPTIDET